MLNAKEIMKNDHLSFLISALTTMYEHEITLEFIEKHLKDGWEFVTKEPEKSKTLSTLYAMTRLTRLMIEKKENEK
mgnify:FL=1